MVGLGLMLKWPSESQDSALSISRWITASSSTFFSLLYKRNTRFHVAVCLIDHRRCQNVVRTSVHSPNGSCATFLFLPHFDVICDLFLNRCMGTWNLFLNHSLYIHNLLRDHKCIADQVKCWDKQQKKIITLFIAHSKKNISQGVCYTCRSYLGT